jgi:DnaK suppressor protein
MDSMTHPETPPGELTPAQLEALRDDLLSIRRRLERSLKQTADAARPVELDQSSVGRLSRMDAIQNQHLTMGLEEREHARYAQVQEAVLRIEAGTYGVCGCGGPIQFERLLVFPETVRCSACASGAG